MKRKTSSFHSFNTLTFSTKTISLLNKKSIQFLSTDRQADEHEQDERPWQWITKRCQK